MCRINPKVDFAFKKLFGSEENKDLLLSFINSVLPSNEQVSYIELKNPYNLANYLNDKMSILDVKAQDDNGTWYDIEIQIAPQTFYDKRALYYWAKVYADQLAEKGRYGIINKVIGINVLDFNYLPDEDYHNMYKIYNSKTKREYSDLLELHFIELQKFNKDLKHLKTTLDRWITFLNKAYEYGKNKIPEELAQDKNIKKAIETLDVMSFGDEERNIYEQRLKESIDRVEQIETALNEGLEEGRKEGLKKGRREGHKEGRKEGLEQGKKEGLKQGIEQGLKEGITQGIEQGITQGIEEGQNKKAIEIAKNLLKLNIDIDTIVEASGLSKDEIEELKM